MYRPELQVCTATRSPCEDQALPLRGPLPLVPRAASPHRGNLVAGYNGFGYLHLVQLAV